ncbi:MAG: hypothetical protein U5K51_06430 [Flavobacteriaceae bacterium]|nr:hypothetical protein [Flavobacteriaceae bacterium]
MKKIVICFLYLGLLFPISLFAQEKEAMSADELAKKLANPIASLISVPFQGNLDVGIGDTNGSKFVMNFQPVIPFKLNENLNLITRWIIPIVSQYDMGNQPSSESGLGDAIISGFLSPANTEITWGVGAAFVVPTATDAKLGGKKWATGPSIVALKQVGPWTYGALANHVWSVAGDEDRSDYSSTFINPFLTYNWKGGAGVNLIAEYTHEWKSDTNIFVIMPTLSAVAKLGKQTTSFGIGPRFHFAPDVRPEYGLRAAITLVFPK